MLLFTSRPLAPWEPKTKGIPLRITAAIIYASAPENTAAGGFIPVNRRYPPTGNSYLEYRRYSPVNRKRTVYKMAFRSASLKLLYRPEDSPATGQQAYRHLIRSFTLMAGARRYAIRHPITLRFLITR